MKQNAAPKWLALFYLRQMSLHISAIECRIYILSYH